MFNGEGWIGFDLDGTLARYDGWRGAAHIGEPIEPMVDRAKEYLANGFNVAIVTARMSVAEQRVQAGEAIKAWCLKHIGQELPVTCCKDYGMIRCYDDRAIQVISNEGVLVQDMLLTSDED